MRLGIIVGLIPMLPLQEKLPTILVLAVLVGIFVSLRRHAKSPRIHLWIAAWGLTLLHFLVQAFEPSQGRLGGFIHTLDLATLQLAGLLFTLSLTLIGEVRRRRLIMLLFLVGPVLIYAAAFSFNLDFPWLYVICLASIFFGTSAYTFAQRPRIPFPFWIMAPFFACGGWAIYCAARHQYNIGIITVLAVAFTISGILFPRRYRVWTTGVVTVVTGFFLWGLSFPFEVLQKQSWPGWQINPELWNVPQLLVALGMVLTLLEDKSKTLEEARTREHAANLQLQRFAGVTSQLLSGIDVRSFCDKIAAAISETSNFRRAGILLCNDDQSLYVAGCHGASEKDADKLKMLCASWNLNRLAEFCAIGERIGQSSVYLKLNQLAPYALPESEKKSTPNPYWENGDEVMIPLLSPRGAYVGCIMLDNPRHISPAIFDEISKIELLAGDLAVTLENAMLHRQLIRSEKLASLGQLVAGVAHELNNPLAAVIGYTDLLTEEVSDAGQRQKLDNLLREAQRMKRIIQNLLRFARRSTLTQSSARVEPIVREVLMLREYHMQSHGVEIVTNIEADLPEAAINEDELKQILLNIFNNAVDAVQSLKQKKIEIECMQQNEKVLIRFEDNGPGFADVNRAFDPFYTTKAVGKGTGLGLSICYGIIKEHGGDIFLKNRWPKGASVVVELPLAAPMSSAARDAQESTVS
jgi:two-component system, NtrC family, sensor kinase